MTKYQSWIFLQLSKSASNRGIKREKKKSDLWGIKAGCVYVHIIQPPRCSACNKQFDLCFILFCRCTSLSFFSLYPNRRVTVPSVHITMTRKNTFYEQLTSTFDLWSLLPKTHTLNFLKFKTVFNLMIPLVSNIIGILWLCECVMLGKTEWAKCLVSDSGCFI